MKIRKVILWLVVCVIVVATIAFWPKKQKPAETSLAPIASSVSPMTVSTNPIQTQSVSTNSQLVTNMPIVAEANYHDKVVGLLSNYNDVPINFYGRLEDQHGDSIPYANVKFIVRVDSGIESDVIRSQVMADGNGAFSITGYHGQDLSVVPQKVGYTLATSGTFFKYSRLEDHPFTSDSYNPTIFKMWKLEGAEPLVEINKTFKIPHTSDPFFVDLITGNIMQTGGDLEVLVTRAQGKITGRKQDRLDWSVELTPVGGGIIETDYKTAQVTFEAPVEGYESNFSVLMNHNDSAWFDSIQKEFFLSSRNGQVYSKFSFSFEINDDPDGTMWIQFKGAANVNASRNWEATVPQ
jgi:hypothetical protein